MLSDLAIWYLRKRKRSVLINFNINGSNVQAETNKVYLYDNFLNEIQYFNPDGSTFNIPEGKFKITT